MRKHLSLMLLLLLLITCTACGQRQTVQRMAADRITQAESVAQLQEVSDLIVVFTPERQENMALTNKYLNNKIVLMALADSDIDVTSAKELADLKIGTQVDSSALQMLMANEAYESFKDNISEYETYDTAIMDLKAGRVDVIAVDQVLGEYTNNNLGGEMKECTYSLGDDYYVIGFEKSNTELRDKVNDAIKALIDNGKAAEISSKWFGKDIVVFEPIA